MHHIRVADLRGETICSSLRELVEQRVRFGNQFLIRRSKPTGELVTTDAPQ
jgi:hypothetical protein